MLVFSGGAERPQRARSPTRVANALFLIAIIVVLRMRYLFLVLALVTGVTA